MSQVLALEVEFMAAVGIAEPPSGYEFRFYSPDDLKGAPKAVDTHRIAQDAERLLDIPTEVADKVFAVEGEFLEMRGLA